MSHPSNRYRIVLTALGLLASLVVFAMPGALAQSPSPSATPTASPSPSPTAAPTSSPSATASPTSSPAPTSSPTGPPPAPGTSDLTVASSSNKLLAQVGDRVNFEVTVTNNGSAPADVVVIDEVPAEMDVLSVPIVPAADSIQLGRTPQGEDIVWVLENLRAGRTARLPWSATAASAGDLEAVNSVEARSAGETTRVADRTYLAAGGDIDSRGHGKAQVMRTIVRRVQVTVPSSGEVTGAPAVLPLTGADVTGVWTVALAAIVAGVLFMMGTSRDRRRRRMALAAVALIVLAACTSTPEDEAAEPSPAPSPTVEDEVRGQQIRRGDGNQNGAPADDAATDITDEPVAVPDAGQPVEVVTRRVVEVVPVERPVVSQETRSGDNSISFQWDADAREVITATSGTSFSNQPSTLTTSLDFDARGLASDITLINSGDDLLRVDGHFELDVISGGNVIARLRSEGVDVVLRKQGRATVAFEYLLPSGDYTTHARFEADGS